MKSKKIWVMISLIVLLTIFTVIGISKHRDSIFASRTIYSKIDIGGYGLFVNCYGKGSPTVIFESGLGFPGEPSKEGWTQVQRKISKIARTFSYDRAGLGDSDPSKLERTSLVQVRELHMLLKNPRIKGPYIIVAHSIGGYNARLFAGTYPKEVAGIVFVDCSNENQFNDNTKNLSTKQIEDMKKLFAKAEMNYDEQIISTKQVEEIRKKDALRNIPIVVLTADHKDANHYEAWEKYQDDIASLSNKSKHILVKNCGHAIQLEKPQVVIDAIKEIIADARK